jgi:hypothetical protein
MAAGPCGVAEDDPDKDGDSALTMAESKAALAEVELSNQAVTLVSGTVEISTNFTIGQAVEAAVDELGSFIATTLPCAAVNIVDNTLTVEYGVYEGDCSYKGLTYAGTHSITVTSAEAGQLLVTHQWTALTNGVIEVSGNATVTWSGADASRNIQHELTWTRLSDGKTATGSGDRTQTLLSGGLLEGIQVDGTRSLVTDAGKWHLDIDEVEMRWIDAVPQSGNYTLDTPAGKQITMTFNREDADTIKVTVASGPHSFDIEVTTLPATE